MTKADANEDLLREAQDIVHRHYRLMERIDSCTFQPRRVFSFLPIDVLGGHEGDLQDQRAMDCHGASEWVWAIGDGRQEQNSLSTHSDNVTFFAQ